MRWLNPCAFFCRELWRHLSLSISVQQRREGGEQVLRSFPGASSFWETFLPGAPSTVMYGESESALPGRATFGPGAFWHPARLPRRATSERGTSMAGAPSIFPQVSSRTQAQARPPSTEPYHIFASTFDMCNLRLPLHGAWWHGEERKEESRSHLPSGSSSSSSSAGAESDPELQRGLNAWIPTRITCGAQYHLYVIAVQRCHALGRLRRAIHAHLGGSGRYVLAGSAAIGDAIYGRNAILLFARTVDVESGAFRLLGSNKRPIVLRGRAWVGGIKGMLGLVRDLCRRS